MSMCLRLPRYVHWKSTIKTWGERNMPNELNWKGLGAVQVAETLALIATPFVKWAVAREQFYPLFQPLPDKIGTFGSHLREVALSSFQLPIA